jgi:hypothetical protein
VSLREVLVTSYCRSFFYGTEIVKPTDSFLASDQGCARRVYLFLHSCGYHSSLPTRPVGFGDDTVCLADGGAPSHLEILCSTYTTTCKYLEMVLRRATACCRRPPRALEGNGTCLRYIPYIPYVVHGLGRTNQRGEKNSRTPTVVSTTRN